MAAHPRRLDSGRGGRRDQQQRRKGKDRRPARHRRSISISGPRSLLADRLEATTHVSLIVHAKRALPWLVQLPASPLKRHETLPILSAEALSFPHEDHSQPTLAGGYLDGQLLVAMPLTDRRFARSVIYMCAHSEEGAMGLIINQRAHHISFAGLERLGIETTGDDGIANNLLAMSVHVGGPVETGRGFVLHTSDYFAADSTLLIDSGVCLTATIDILKAIASGGGRTARSSRSATPAGPPGSSRARFRATAG